MVDLSAQTLDVCVRDPEPRLAEIADDSDDAFLRSAPAAPQLLQPPARALAHEHVDGPLALEKLLDQVPADEPRRAGDEIGQSVSFLRA